ncbi:cytidine and dCMP deaminase domain-containing protein 1 [Diretmus argenteus]
METAISEEVKKNRADPGRSRPGRDVRETGTQTDHRVQGSAPRLSKANLFTLLSLWMELFPQEQPEDEGRSQVRGTGLVVVQDGKVMGLHCSGPELHAGQAAIIRHGARLANCQLYFSRRPCATCLKMIINAGVSQISFWPGDPEVSMLHSASTNHSRHPSHDGMTQEAALDAVATETLKSNSRPHICVGLQPLAPGLAQFIDETSRGSDFMEKVTGDEPELDTHELFTRQRRKHLETFSRDFLVGTEQQHRKVLTQMGLENFCMEPYFSSLRHNMRELVEVLAALAAGLPQLHHGFYRDPSSPGDPESSRSSRHQGVSQEVARHCMIQARLLAHRTEDPKVGVGAVIWAERQSAGCDGTGRLYLVGCGYNAYPAGSQYAEYPQMDTKQQDRQRRKYRYIIHAEQNALTFRSGDLRPEESTMMFVTKCPCDECVPLIRGAGITHVYTTDQDSGKDKGDISYLRFRGLKGVSKFIWQKCPVGSASSSHLATCFLELVVGGAATLYGTWRRCRRGKRAGALVKLRQRGHRTPLPSIHLANVRSLPNKMDELLLLNGSNKDFARSAALCFTETWLSEAVPDAGLHLPGFSLHRADRVKELSGKTKGGGICFYINEVLGHSDHCLVHLIPTYRQKLKTAKPVVKTVKRWTPEAKQELQACFDCTDWSVFEAANDNLDDLTDTVKTESCSSTMKTFLLSSQTQTCSMPVQCGDLIHCRDIQMNPLRRGVYPSLGGVYPSLGGVYPSLGGVYINQEGILSISSRQ